MNKIKLACFISILAVGISHASTTPCNGFEIKIKNNSPDDFLINRIELKGADIQPYGIQILKAKASQIFTINNSKDGRDMDGAFELHSISLPSKSILVLFNLQNQLLICHHHNKEISGDYTIDQRRWPGNVTYTIG